MMHDLVTSPFLVLPAAALLGFAVGLLYFAAVRRTADRIARHDGWLQPAALTIGRLAGAAVLFVFVARLGAWPLLAAFGGFLVARAVVRRAERSATAPGREEA